GGSWKVQLANTAYHQGFPPFPFQAMINNQRTCTIDSLSVMTKRSLQIRFEFILTHLAHSQISFKKFCSLVDNPFDPGYINSCRNTEEYPSLVEGVGLENRKGCQSPRGFESLFLLHYTLKSA